MSGFRRRGAHRAGQVGLGAMVLWGLACSPTSFQAPPRPPPPMAPGWDALGTTTVRVMKPTEEPTPVAVPEPAKAVTEAAEAEDEAPPPSGAPQSFTPEPKAKSTHVQLRTQWSATVGQLHPSGTMAVVARRLVVGTAGTPGKNGVAPGAYVLDPVSGQVEQVIHGSTQDPQPVMGVAAMGEDLVFVEARMLVRATVKGKVLWSAHLIQPGKGAPVVGDFNGDRSADVAVMESGGVVAAYDGKTGRSIWRRSLGAGGGSFMPATADLDGDGIDDVVAGRDSLAAFRGKDGTPIWALPIASPLVGSPHLVDLDGDGRLEVIVAREDATVTIYDGKKGTALWSKRVEKDDGTPEAITAAPVPVAGPRHGYLVVPYARSQKEGGLIVLNEYQRAFRSSDGGVVGSPVVLKLNPEGIPDALAGTQSGALVALDATGGRSWITDLGSPVESTPLVLDINGDGLQELLVVTADGKLSCLATGVGSAPSLSRLGGESFRNKGLLTAVDLGWSFSRTRMKEKQR